MSLVALTWKISLAEMQDPIKKNVKLDKRARRIGKKIRKEEYDAEDIKRIKQNNKQNVLALQQAMKRASAREIPSLEKKTMREIRSYERSSRRQVQDYVEIIQRLQELIEKEDLELLFDLDIPLKTINHLITTINLRLRKESKEDLPLELDHIIKYLKNEHERLMEETKNLVNHELSYFHRFGLVFERVTERKEQRHVTHLEKRARFEQDLRKKTISVKNSIEPHEISLRKVLREQNLSATDKSMIRTTLRFLKNQYGELINYILERVQASTQMITESIQLQKDHYKDLKELHQEAENFYKEFLRELNTGNPQEAKRKELFEKYQKEMRTEIAKLNKEQLRLLEESRDIDLKILHVEKKELRRIERAITTRQKKFSQKMKIVLIAMSIAFSVAVITPTNSSSGITQVINTEATANNVINTPAAAKKLEAKKIIGSIPKILTKSSTSYQYCAEWSNSVFQEILGAHTSRRKLGIQDDAWQVADSIVKHGGVYIYNAFDKIQKEHKGAIHKLAPQVQAKYKELRRKNSKDRARVLLNNLYADSIRAFIPKTFDVNINQLQPYDLVGMYQPKSDFQARAFQDNPTSTFNTHIGIVSKNTDGEVIISHNIYGRINHDKAKNCRILWIARPAYNEKVLQKLANTIAQPKSTQF